MCTSGHLRVAELAGVSRTVVSNWRARDHGFLARSADLRSGPVFGANRSSGTSDEGTGHGAHIISTINLKGGVGKTTTTAAPRRFLSAEFGKVLVIDLDPQTNPTTCSSARRSGRS